MKKENKSSSTIIIVILLILVLALSGYIGYDKIISNKNNNTNNSTGNVANEEKIELTLTKAEEENFEQIISGIPEVIASNLQTPEKIDNQTKLKGALIIMDLYPELKDITGKNLKQALINTFGTDLGLKNETINCNIDHGSTKNNILYEYNSSTDVYSYNKNHLGHGGAANEFENRYAFIKEYKFEDNKVIITVNKLFTETEDSGESAYYYLKYEDYLNLKNVQEPKEEFCEVNTADDLTICDYDKIYNYEKSKLEDYTYTFEKINNNYVLKNITK